MAKILPPYSQTNIQADMLSARIEAATTATWLAKNRTLVSVEAFFTVPVGFYSAQYLAILELKAIRARAGQVSTYWLGKCVPAVLGLLLIVGIGISPALHSKHTDANETIYVELASGALIDAYAGMPGSAEHILTSQGNSPATTPSTPADDIEDYSYDTDDLF